MNIHSRTSTSRLLTSFFITELAPTVGPHYFSGALSVVSRSVVSCVGKEMGFFYHFTPTVHTGSIWIIVYMWAATQTKASGLLFLPTVGSDLSGLKSLSSSSLMAVQTGLGKLLAHSLEPRKCFTLKTWYQDPRQNTVLTSEPTHCKSTDVRNGSIEQSWHHRQWCKWPRQMQP